MEEVTTRPRITTDTLERIKSFFEQYVSSFRKDEEYNRHIKLKQYHTVRVVKEISDLCEALGLDDEESAFARVIAWLHDIGRFEQFDTYETFDDAESENHAEVALRVIKKYDLLKDFTREQVQIIERTILNHNQKQIPVRESETISFYSRLLRDADKLDIWRVTLQTNIFHTIKNEKLPNTYLVPEKILSFFESHQTIPLSEVDSFYDSILFRLSWVFDLNFNCTMEKFIERNFIEKFLEKLPFSVHLQKIKEDISEYLDERLH